MKPRVYVETSVFSYLTARASRDAIVSGQQELAKSWWANGAGLTSPRICTPVELWGM
jgi:hypothetical protein